MKNKNNTPSSEERWTEVRFIKFDGTIESFPNYLVSDMGRIGSTVTNHGNVRETVKILKPQPYDKLGHLHVRLYINKKSLTKKVHRIVLSSFCPESWSKDTNEIDHINRDPTDNRLCNLKWVDRVGNIANRSNMKKIKVTYLSDGHTEVFENMLDCCRAFGKSKGWCNVIIREHEGFSKKYNIQIEKLG